jgi:hypothetical protein
MADKRTDRTDELVVATLGAKAANSVLARQKGLAAILASATTDPAFLGAVDRPIRRRMKRLAARLALFPKALLGAVHCLSAGVVGKLGVAGQTAFDLRPLTRPTRLDEPECSRFIRLAAFEVVLHAPFLAENGEM